MIKLLKNIFRHKKYIFKYGQTLEVGELQLLLHDLDKLRPCRLIGYWIEDLPANHFLFSIFNKELLQKLVDNARFNHKRVNKHHIEYWLFYNVDTGKVECKDIPDKYLREMAVDWVSAYIVNSYVLPKSIEEWPLAKRILSEEFISEENREKLRKYIEFLLGYRI